MFIYVALIVASKLRWFSLSFQLLMLYIYMA